MFESKVKRILVPVQGASTDEESLGLAAAFAKRERAEILVLYVIEVKRALPLDADIAPELARSEDVLEKLQHVAERLGLRVQSDVLQAREAGSAIVNEAVERNIDLVVMGVPYQERFGDFTVGARALYVLDHAPCRVVLVREPLKHQLPRTA
jgi:nucleotide-binding universal stress UspA family protein